MAATTLTTSKEVFSFFVYLVRTPTTGPNWWLKGNAIDVSLTQTDVSHEYCNYLKGHRRLRGCGVRVPALMFLSGGGEPEDVCQHFLNHYRKQFGCHLFINADRCQLSSVPGYWGPKRIEFDGTRAVESERKYTTHKERPVANMYPCFRPGKPPEMVLGVCYGGAGHPERRSYGRYNFPIEDNRCAFDITEEFFDPNRNAGHHRHYRDRQFAGRGEFVVAFYLCRGARLVVTDERYTPAANMPSRVVDKHVRSLYQQGGLVVAKAKEFEVRYGYKNNIADKGESWSQFIQLLRPENRAMRMKNKRERAVDPGEGVAGVERRLVIFLGATESQHNSVSWELDAITYRGTRSEPYKFRLNLKLPENGFIVDITTWNHGFQLIRARHHYEKLYESVLTAPNNFGWPAFKRPTNYLLRRVLGTPREKEKWGAMRIEYPYEKLQVPHNYQDRTGGVEDCDIRRYIAQTKQTYEEPAMAMIELPIGLATSPQWTYQGNPVTFLPDNYPSWVPPFYPAVWDPDSKMFFYIDHLMMKNKITQKPNGKFIISSRPSDQEFELMFTRYGKTYPWVRSLENHMISARNVWKDGSMTGRAPTARYGADGLKYVMFATDSVPMAMYYLHPCDDIKKQKKEKEKKRIKKKQKENEKKRMKKEEEVVDGMEE